MKDGKMSNVRERPKLAKNLYFTGEKPNYSFIKTGCTVLDCALGGGYALGHISNIVGDKSTAKTGLAMEAVSNFLRAYPKGAAAYRETEAAFDKGYAAAMGMPVEKVDFADAKPLITVEDFARDIDAFLEKRVKDQQVGIYVLDSLDALSDEAEMEREFGKATYGMAKAKNLSEFFRRTARKIEQSKVLLLLVSQVRENIGVAFGEKYRRAGGKALDHNASQILWLAMAGASLKRSVKGVERVYGVPIRAKVKKNKVGFPFREANFNYIFGYGMDDLAASVEWLKEVKHWPEKSPLPKAFMEMAADMSDEDYNTTCAEMAKLVQQAWVEVETSFLPKRSKYG